jgi:hypothetical protein
VCYPCLIMLGSEPETEEEEEEEEKKDMRDFIK